jgi:hypothetical protein
MRFRQGSFVTLVGDSVDVKVDPAVACDEPGVLGLDFLNIVAADNEDRRSGSSGRGEISSGVAEYNRRF